MTTARRPAPRPRTLQEDLLDDLRQATPMPAGPPAGHQPAPAPPAAAPAEPRSALGVELRVTPQRWTAVSWRSLPGWTGFVLSAGPVRLSIGVLPRD